MNRRYGWPTAIAVLIVGLLLGWWASPRAEAHETQTHCTQAWQAGPKVKAHCRSEGWVVRPNFVLTPNKRVAYIGGPFRPCKYEDSDGPCYWVASERGNKQGRSFIIRGERDGKHRIWWGRF